MHQLNISEFSECSFIEIFSIEKTAIKLINTVQVFVYPNNLLTKVKYY